MQIEQQGEAALVEAAKGMKEAAVFLVQLANGVASAIEGADKRGKVTCAIVER